MPNSRKVVRIALLDLYAAQVNEGMRCLRNILAKFCLDNKRQLHLDEFDVRTRKELPGLDYDIYISSGGPGSPLESEGSDWEKAYFKWLRQVERWNKSADDYHRKHILLICHSFELVCRYYKIARVCKRKSTAFGVFPVHLLEEGKQDPAFKGLNDPFYALDSRSYQVIVPDFNKLKKMGANVLAIEKERPHIPLERAIMALRFNQCMLGTQFHPEADASGTSAFLSLKEKKAAVIAEHSETKWINMIDQLKDPDKILHTHSTIIPNFLNNALAHQLKRKT